jgi:hypothetical protein
MKASREVKLKLVMESQVSVRSSEVELMAVTHT